MHDINKKLAGIVLACGLAVPLAASASADAGATESASASSVLIKGFAQYQAKRVENILLDQFVDDLARQPYFQLFFPQTSRAIGDYDGIAGKRLIPLMSYYFNEDLSTVKRLGDCLRRDRADLDKVNAFSRWVETFRPPKAGAATPQRISPEAFLKTIYGDAAAACGSQAATQASEKKGPDKENAESQNVEWLVARLENPAFTSPFGKALYENLNPGKRSEIKATREKLLPFVAPSQPTPEDLSAIDAFVRLANTFDGGQDMTDPVRVHNVLTALAALGIGNNDHANFTRFRSGALFLASLREAQKAKDANAVEAAIKAFVQDGDAYQSKHYPSGIAAYRRNEPTLVCRRWVTCGNNLFIGSYFGVAFDHVDDGSGEREWRGRAFGPVGLELKLLDVYGYPVSVNAAPYDIGGYITSELRGSAYDARLDDIKTPSYFLAVSAPHRPFAVLVGYQQDVQTAPGRREDVGFLSFAFDLPLLRLH